MGIKIDFVKETDKEYEEIKKLIPSASKYAFMKVDHLIVVPLFQVMDIINKYEKQDATTKNDLGVDCISREQAINAVNMCSNSETILNLQQLPPVTPIRPKGHWISRWHAGHDLHFHVCSECNEEFSCDMETGISIDDYRYCPNCGADMREVEE